MREPIKVQRPLATNDPNRPWLFYNESRTVEAQFPERDVDPLLIKAMGGRAKAFFLAEVRNRILCFDDLEEVKGWNND